MTYRIDYETGSVAEGTTWFTAPGWTRAHEMTVAGTMGHLQFIVTMCGRDYPEELERHESPLRAPDDMPRCKACVRLGVGSQ